MTASMSLCGDGMSSQSAGRLNVSRPAAGSPIRNGASTERVGVVPIDGIELDGATAVVDEDAASGVRAELAAIATTAVNSTAAMPTTPNTVRRLRSRAGPFDERRGAVPRDRAGLGFFAVIGSSKGRRPHRGQRPWSRGRSGSSGSR